MRLAVDFRKTLHSPAREVRLDIRFEATEPLAVLYGPSGSGKSVTLQTVAGLVRPDDGSIRFGERVLYDTAAGLDVPARHRRIGHVFQDYALFPHMTVHANVAAAVAPLFGRAMPAADRERVASLLEAFELDAVRASYPAQISGGQRQRTAIARALVAQPDLLLLDEPFNALDIALRERMRREVLQVWERFHVPILIVSHDPADLALFGREVFEIEDGRIRSRTAQAS